MKKFTISWTNSQGKKCKHEFDTTAERTMFAEMLYINDMDKFGKISRKRPTEQEIRYATTKILAKNPYSAA